MEYDYTYETIEKILLKRALKDKKYLNILSLIFDTRWFDKNRNNAIILDLAIKYYKKYQKVPDNKVLKYLIVKQCEKNPSLNINDINNALININSFDVTIDDECANTNIQNYIREKSLYYSISDNINEIQSSGNIDKCLKRFDKVQKLSFQDDDLGMNYFSTSDMDKHWDYIKNPEAKISTGWKALDYHTHGGFLKDGRMLALFVGQAGLGKSLFLANITTNFLRQNKSVVVISLEMSQDVYAQRFDSMISQDNINNLKNTAANSRFKIEEFYKNHSNANLIIKEYPPKSIRVVDIESYLDKLVASGTHIDIIVIDYLNLVLPNTKMDNMYQSVMAVAEQLRSLSYKFNAPVISATQTNRSGMNNEHVDMQNISESNGQAATADFIGILYTIADERESGKINMRLVKNRFGAPGKSLQFQLNKENLALEDITFNMSEANQNSEASQITANLANISSDMNEINNV